MLSEKIISMTNEQIKKEFESAYLYLEIASFYEEHNLCGFANWFLVQAKEEQEHAIRFYNYLHDNEAPVTFFAITPPEVKFIDFTMPLSKSLSHEQYVTSSINEIYAQADSEKDYRTMDFLDWFIKEQQEEEVNARNLIEQMRLFGKTPEGLYELDKKYGKRE